MEVHRGEWRGMEVSGGRTEGEWRLMADSSGVCTHLYGFFGVDDPVSVDVQGSKTLTNLGNLQVDR